MPRRTKEEAQQTRHDLLDAAERVFEARGVAGASLQEVAQAAGVTRGAVYWHFEGKVELFNALMDRAILPFEQSWLVGGPDHAADPAGRLRAVLCDILRQTAHDTRLQRVLRIATQRVEYVGELDGIRQRRLVVCDQALRRIEKLLRLAATGPLRPALPPRVAARALHALVDGLIDNWMLDPTAFDLERVGCAAVDRLLAALLVPVAAVAAGSMVPAPRPAARRRG